MSYLKDKGSVLFIVGIIAVALLITFTVAQGGGNLNISKRCGATEVEGDYVFKIYPTYTSYHAELVAGRCETVLRNKISNITNVRRAIAQDVVQQVSSRNMTWEILGFKDSEITGRGNFTLT